MTEESKKFIDGLVEKLATQDNLSTQNIAYMVSEEVKTYTGDWGSEYERIEDSETCDSCDKILEDNGELADHCCMCPEESFVSYNLERKINTSNGSMYLTQEACQSHIDANDYHYGKPMVYGVSLWRNPEMIQLINVLFDIAGKEVPNWYDKR